MTDQPLPIEDEFEELEEIEVDEVIEALELLADQVNSESIRSILEDAATEVHALFYDDTDSQAESQAA